MLLPLLGLTCTTLTLLRRSCQPLYLLNNFQALEACAVYPDINKTTTHTIDQQSFPTPLVAMDKTTTKRFTRDSRSNRQFLTT